MYKIPFNKVTLAGNEFDYMRLAVEDGHISGNGPFTKKCHDLLESQLGVDRALLTTSCTHALEMAALLINLKPGDEVIIPSFTFVSTANPFVLRGAIPVFADIRPDTLNIDENKLEELITPRTRAISPVHYAGVGCEMDPIMDIANHYKIKVIEDNAHGLYASYKGKFLGTFGPMAAQSFHETKNFTCGEGGALLVNDPEYSERAEIIREKGTNRSRFFRGQVDKYTWVDVGSSFLPSEILGAFLFAQLEGRDKIQATRKKIWDFYYNNLISWAETTGTFLPTVPAYCEQSYHMFYLILPSMKKRQDMIAHLKARGIQSVFHFLPLNISEMGERFGGKPGDCPVTEDLSDRLVRIPFFNSLTEEEQTTVVEAILDFPG